MNIYIGFDHHCAWLSNCIGKANYPYFFCSILFAILSCLLLFAICIFVICRLWIIDTFTFPNSTSISVNDTLLQITTSESPPITSSNNYSVLEPSINTTDITPEDVDAKNSSDSKQLNINNKSNEIQHRKGYYNHYSSHLDDIITKTVIFSLVCLVLIIILVMLLHLFIFHIYIRFHGLTTYEYLRPKLNLSSSHSSRNSSWKNSASSINHKLQNGGTNQQQSKNHSNENGHNNKNRNTNENLEQQNSSIEMSNNSEVEVGNSDEIWSTMTEIDLNNPQDPTKNTLQNKNGYSYSKKKKSRLESFNLFPKDSKTESTTSILEQNNQHSTLAKLKFWRKAQNQNKVNPAPTNSPSLSNNAPNRPNSVNSNSNSSNPGSPA